MATDTDKNLYALIGDVGGTNTRLQLVSFTYECLYPNVIKTQFFRTSEHRDLTECVNEFLKDTQEKQQYPQAAVLAVAGAPYEGRVLLPNTSWPVIDEKDLQIEFKIKQLYLINDFVSIGYSIPRVSCDELDILHDAKRIAGGTIIVAGPGTGMGECILQPCKCQDSKIRYNVYGTEGGHKNFAPSGPLEWEYMNFMMEECKDVFEKFGYLSTESAFCGPGIPKMHKFMCGKNSVSHEPLTSEEIIKRGLENSDDMCRKTLEFFCSLYAKEIADFALNSLPYGGIYLVGGLTNVMSEYLIKDPSCPFKKSYFSKGKIINQVLERFPIYIVKQKELGLFGSFIKAQREVHKCKDECDT